MNTFINVTYSRGMGKVTLAPQYQYNRGQQLRILNVEENVTVSVHYAVRGMLKPIIRFAEFKDKAWLTSIPNSLMAQKQPIIAYVYIISDDSAQTIFEIEIPIIERPIPDGYEITDEEADELERLIRDLQQALKATESVANISATAHMLPSEESPTVTVDDTDNGKTIIFGIPRGEKGLYVGNTEPESKDIDVWIDPDEDADLRGPQGERGYSIYSASAEPSVEQDSILYFDCANINTQDAVRVGDMVLCTLTCQLYEVVDTTATKTYVKFLCDAKGNTGDVGPTGNTGAPGANATITDVNATVDANVGTPHVSVSLGGTESARTFDFSFRNLKGETGNTGANGISPVVSVDKSGKATTLTITDADGTKTATINDGNDGLPGADGYTPVKYTDYWTEDDKKEIIDILHYPVTPQMFGAVGDGEADDTVAMQAAFDEVAKNGSYLYIPKGKYKVTRPITVDWGRYSETRRNFLQKIVGAGSQAFERYYDNSVIIGYNIPAYRGVIELIGSGNTWGTQTRIEDLAIECDKSSCDTMSFALMYGDARNFMMHRVKLRGHNGIYARCGSIVDENGASATTTYEQINVKFEQCDIFTFEDSVRGFAFLPEGVVTRHFSVMDNIIFDSCLFSGMVVVTSVNVMFISCHVMIYNVANKLITTDNVGLLNGHEIDYATGYYVAQAMNAVFQNCYFEDNRRSWHITPTLGNVRNVSIQNCYINPGCNQFNSDGSRLNADYGIRISPGNQGKYVRNVVVQNNVFRLVSGDTEFVIANVSNECAEHFVFRDNCTTSTLEVPKIVNTTASGYDIQNGLDSGASVKSMTTSADGKALTISLTNGKSITFNTGASAPVKGVDYFTEAEIDEIKSDVTVHTDAYIVSELAKRGQLKPEFAQSEEECTDKTKLYVLPDGYIYGYVVDKAEDNLYPTFTNLMDDSNAYIKKGQRYSNSSAAWKDHSSGDSLVVPFKHNGGDFTLRARGVADGAGYSYVYFGTTNTAFPSSLDGLTWSTDANGDLILTGTLSSLTGYITFVVKPVEDASKVIVTMNEEIAYSTTGGSWSENLVPKSINTDGNVYNTTGYKSGYRLNSSGVEIEQNNSVVTGFIPCNKNDTIRVTGMPYGPAAYCSVYGYIACYDASFNKLASTSWDNILGSNGTYQGVTAINDKGTYEPDSISTLTFDGVDDTMAYIRVSSSDGFKNNTSTVYPASNLSVTKYVEGGTTVTESWVNTGHAFVPADYEDRIVDLEAQLDNVKNDIGTLQKKVSSAGIANGANAAFATPAYAPIPQHPADGTFDFHGLNVTTDQAHTYMDALATKYKGYVTKQTMGKDQSGAYDHNRYILCKAYWRAWLKPNYPMMFAWKNGSTVIYSVSCSPRVNDTMYTTPYIGAAYGTVTSVNASVADASNSIPGTPSTRTINGLMFERYKAGDVAPTFVYTKVESSLTALNSSTVYDSSFNELTKVTAYTKEAITCANGIVYTRYPFEDLKADKTKPLSVFVLANEHGHHGDNKVPSISLMRMAKDLCENRENPFLQWLKENAMLTLIPVGNPWGYDPSVGDSGAGYNNSRGVNINRNYDTPGWAGSDNNYGDDTTFGAYPGSENETQHIMNTMHLCKAKVGLSMHGLGLGQYKTQATEYADGLMWQGCGYDKARMTKVAEVLFSDYGMLIGGHTSWDQSYEYCGKSPAYIQYVGAVGGLNEIPDIETGTLDLYTPTVMEAAYTQMLLFLQVWCEEALEKLS